MDNPIKTEKHDAMQIWLHQNRIEMLPQVMKIAKGFSDTIYSEKPLKKEFSIEEMQFDMNKIQSEVVLKEKTFVKGVIDSIWTLKYFKPLHKSEKCPISESVFKEVEQLETVGEVLDYANHLLKERGKPIYDNASNGKIRQGCGDWVYDTHKYEWEGDKLNDFDTFIHHAYPWVMDWRNKYKTVGFYARSHFLIEIKPYVGKKGANAGDTLRQINTYVALSKELKLNGMDSRMIIPCLFTLSTEFDNFFEDNGIHVLHPPVDFDINEVISYYGL